MNEEPMNRAVLRSEFERPHMTDTPPRPLLDLDPDRPVSHPTDAATLVLIRDTDTGLEVFCVRRVVSSRFMGGAVVFPGGKVEAGDYDSAWQSVMLPPGSRVAELGDADMPQALSVAACRECLEEAAILPVDGVLVHDDALVLRDILTQSHAELRAALVARHLRLNVAALVPFARWVTPTAERRRFDARFFMMRAPDGQHGVHDTYETSQCFWERPADLLARWSDGAIQLAPPTHHTLWTLAGAASVDEALAGAAQRPLQSINPLLVAADETWALTLPGDPQHPESLQLIDGPTRYVLRGDQWRPE